jgi:hypothetical protein
VIPYICGIFNEREIILMPNLSMLLYTKLVCPKGKYHIDKFELLNDKLKYLKDIKFMF